MTCLCLPRLQLLLGGLGPVATLRVPLPSIVTTLAATLTAPAPASSAALAAALQLSLPPLPLPLLAIEQIAATASATSQLALHMGIDLLHADGPSQLALSLGSLRLMLPSVLPQFAALRIDFAAAMQLSLGLSAIAHARTTLGIDLLAPNAALALKLALSARLGMPLPAWPVPSPAMLRVAAYARLALAASAFGGVGRLIPALQLIARIQLPSLGLPLPTLAGLSLLIGLRSAIQATLGLDVTMPGLQLRLQAALQPLWALSSLAASLAVGASAASWCLPSPGAGFALDAQALASLGLGAIAGLRLPDLAPLALLAGVAGAGALAAPDCCAAH